MPIWKDHQKYLQFLWKGTLHEFAFLPFGLATAPRVFTKLMKPVVAALRQRGIRLIIYLDDILIMAESQALALHHAASTLNLLEGLGFYSQLQQVPVNPLPEYRVFGLSDQFNQSHPPVARGETQENPKDLPRSSRKDRNFGSRVIKIPRPPNLFNPGHFPRPPPLPTSSKAEEHYNNLRAIVRGHINTRFSSPRGSSVVARPPSRVE